MSKEKRSPLDIPSTPVFSADVPQAEREKVVKVVELIKTYLPEGEEIVGLNCVVATIKHDGSEDHENCQITTRHMGAAAEPSVMKKLADATVRSAIVLLSHEQKSDPLDALLANIVKTDDEKGS